MHSLRQKDALRWLVHGAHLHNLQNVTATCR